jgi:hypothetical protein
VEGQWGRGVIMKNLEVEMNDGRIKIESKKNE